MNAVEIKTAERLFGAGLYSVAEASRLTRVPAATFRRWVFGYARTRTAGRVEYKPISQPEIGRIDGQYVVGFHDLLEARVVQAFRQAGVSWHVIRLAAQNVQGNKKLSHPFLSRHFRTDGRTIFLETAEALGKPELLDLARNQHAFHSVIAPSLFKQIEFDDNDEAILWYPLWPKKTVIIDPQRSFGRPLVANIPADTLAATAHAENSVEAAARWYNITPDRVRDAIAWQDRLAA